MIVEALLGLIAWILEFVLLPLEIQELPETFVTVVASILSYIVQGVSILCVYIHPVYIGALLAFVISFNAAINAYRLILFIVKKIPFLNIK